MATAERTPMTEAEQDQILQAWFSPAYPIGAFAYSHGLETVIADGDVTTPAALTAWVGDILRAGSGRNDAILLLAAAAPGADLPGLSALAEALAPSRERHLETMAQGEAFARVTAEVWGTEAAPRPYPVAVGAAAAALGLDPAKALRLYLHAFAANFISAAVRAIPIGQTDGQKCLAALLPVIEAVAGDAADATLEDIGSATQAADIAAIAHETQPVRLFRT